MNPTLVRIIRERMQSQTTEQLLDLWVINDRATWSPEAFEAVRTLLADRGRTDLPPQNDPPPVGRRRTLHNDPVAAYWFEWLRPVLVIAIIVAVLGVVRQGIGMWAMREYFDPSQALYRPMTTVRMLLEAALPLSLLVSALGCLRLVPAARSAAIAWAWLSITVATVNAVPALWRQFSANFSYTLSAGYGLTLLQMFVESLVLPIVLMLLLRRPEIRAIFVPRGGPGFEPALAPPTKPTAENASR
jgi:hypothetical protein